MFVLLSLLEAYLLINLMLFQYRFNKQLLKDSYLTFAERAIKNYDGNIRIQKTLQQWVVRADCRAKRMLREWLSPVTLQGWMLVAWVSSSSTNQPVIMGLKWACDNLKAASVVSVKTCVVRTLRLFAWWVHTVLCSAGSSHSHDWAEGSYCNLLWLGTSWNGRKQDILTCVSPYFCELFYFSYTWASV